MSAVTVGYLLPTFEATGENSDRIAALLDLGVEAERLGFDTMWLPDSPFQYGLPDPLTMIAALAVRTRHVTLASGVLLAALRHPALLAQQLASLDALAGGRVRAGFGLGFRSPESEQQFTTAGVPFATRAARLEESIALMRAAWSTPGRPVSYDGVHVTVRDLALSPAPARPGGPPVWLAGAGPRAERRAGRLADGWLPYFPKASDYASGWLRVQDAAANAGRPRPPRPGALPHGRARRVRDSRTPAPPHEGGELVRTPARAGRFVAGHVRRHTRGTCRPPGALYRRWTRARRAPRGRRTRVRAPSGGRRRSGYRRPRRQPH